MSIKRVLLASMAMLSVGMMAFATSTAIVDDDGTANSTYEENTYSLYKKDAASDSEDSIAFTEKAALATTTGNETDTLMLVSEVPVEPIVTALYYEGTDVTTTTKAKVLFDKDWNVEDGFKTGTFAVAVSGSTANSKQKVYVGITASPFYLNSGSTVYGGAVSIIVSSASQGKGKYSASSEDSNASTFSAGSTKTEDSNVFFNLAKNTYYDGYNGVDYDATANNGGIVGHMNGTVVTFAIKAAVPDNKRKLPSGRYISTVTLAYAVD
ncbi:MAG: hypothetical protein LKE40_05955 [Spirochaetia bacterium]|nr:hypothetical protein [Spirochaetia bacterium]